MTHVYRTDEEKGAAARVAEIFERCADPIPVRLENFPKYVRRQDLKRFLAMYEIFKLVLPVKGSVVECGVFRGFGLMAWAKLSTILEPENLTRRVYGFDTFAGFPAVGERDRSPHTRAAPGDLSASSYEELQALLAEYDRDRFLGQIPKVSLIKGDIAVTAPQFVKENPHLVVSLLFLDADLYEPTRAALDAFLPRMPRGAVLAFDELDNPLWPGETRAALEAVGLRQLRLLQIPGDPYIAYAVMD